MRSAPFLLSGWRWHLRGHRTPKRRKHAPSTLKRLARKGDQNKRKRGKDAGLSACGYDHQTRERPCAWSWKVRYRLPVAAAMAFSTAGAATQIAIGDHRHPIVFDLDDFLYTRVGCDLRGVKSCDLAAIDGACREGRVKHSGQANIDSENRLALSFVGRVEPLYVLADELPVFGILERD